MISAKPLLFVVIVPFTTAKFAGAPTVPSPSLTGVRLIVPAVARLARKIELSISFLIVFTHLRFTSGPGSEKTTLDSKC